MDDKQLRAALFAYPDDVGKQEAFNHGVDIGRASMARELIAALDQARRSNQSVQRIYAAVFRIIEDYRARYPATPAAEREDDHAER